MREVVYSCSDYLAETIAQHYFYEALSTTQNHLLKFEDEIIQFYLAIYRCSIEMILDQKIGAFSAVRENRKQYAENIIVSQFMGSRLSCLLLSEAFQRAGYGERK